MRALVLGGGGPVGIAWEAGVAAVLDDAGVDLGSADLIIGTSAGSVVGAQIALGRNLRTMLDRYSSESPSTDAPPDPARGATGEQMNALMAAFTELFTSDAPPEERRAKLGKIALEANTIGEQRFIDGFGQLADAAWPARYACTAIDAHTGEFVLWNEDSGVELVRAVASSCAVPGIFPPITINGRRYMDGGMRSVTNSDLAADHERVLIFSVFTGGERSEDPRMQARRQAFDDELDVIRSAGGRVEVISPTGDDLAAIGMNVMNPAYAPQAAAAGERLGKEIAPSIASFWS